MMLCPFPDDLGILLYPEICPILPSKSNTSNPNTSKKQIFLGKPHSTKFAI
jgi:hypothetical protein